MYSRRSNFSSHWRSPLQRTIIVLTVVYFCVLLSAVKYLNATCNVMPHTTPPLLLPRPPSWRRSTKCVGFREQSSWQRSTSSVRKSCSGRTAPESAAHDGPNAKAALSTNHASVNTTTKLLQEVYTVGHYPFNFHLHQFLTWLVFSQEGCLRPFSEINPSSPSPVREPAIFA